MQKNTGFPLDKKPAGRADKTGYGIGSLHIATVEIIQSVSALAQNRLKKRKVG